MSQITAVCLIMSTLLTIVCGRGGAMIGKLDFARRGWCVECPKQQFDVYELRWSLIALVAIIVLFVIVCICRCHPTCRQIWKKAEAPVMSRSASMVGKKFSSPRKESTAQDKQLIIPDV